MAEDGANYKVSQTKIIFRRRNSTPDRSGTNGIYGFLPSELKVYAYSFSLCPECEHQDWNHDVTKWPFAADPVRQN